MFWLCGWTFGELSVLGILSWMIAGHQVLTLSRDTLVIRLAVGPLGRTREYQLDAVRRLRVAATHGGKGQVTTTARAFDYGAKTIRFGVNIDDAEAHHARDLLLEREPRLAE